MRSIPNKTFLGFLLISRLKHLPIPLIVAFLLAGSYINAIAADEIPVEGAICSVNSYDGRQRTNLEIVIGRNFKGKLPEEIDSISVSGPSGILDLSKEDFNYNSQWRSFWVSLPGAPATGKYIFKVTSGGLSGVATDIQLVNRVIPLPDTNQFHPTLTEENICSTSTFSWPLTPAEVPLYYRLEINDRTQNVYRTEYIREMNSLRVPRGKLDPGVEYRWRVRVADGSNWLTLNNRSQSRWIKFIPSSKTSACVYQYNPPIKMNDGWVVSNLCDVGIDEKILTSLMIKILNEEITNIQGLLIIKNGKLVFEEYLGGYALNIRHPVASVTKSITSILIGIAIEQEKIPNVNCSIYDLLPSYREHNWDKGHKGIQLKHVLTMTAGLDWNAWEFPEGDIRDTTTAMVRSNDWIKFTLTRETVQTPGKKFVYNNGLSIILGEVIRNTTGLDADEFAEKYLFSHLGITDYRWGRAKNNIIQTAGGLEMRPRDMAKIGSLMINSGVWKKRQIAPPHWVNESTNPYLKGHFLFGSGYGYQWWQGESFIGDKKIDLFYAAGKGGQYIFVCPELDLVTVVTSEVRDNPLGEYRPQLIMANYVIPAVLPQEITEPDTEIYIVDKEKYIGEYFCSIHGMKVKIIQNLNGLFYIDSENQKGKLHFISENQCIANSKGFGNIRAILFKDLNSKVAHFDLQVGFGFWHFDKVN